MSGPGPPVLPAASSWRPLLELALAEDVGPGDVTTTLVVPADRMGGARIEARESLIVCGLELAEAAFTSVDSRLQLEPLLGAGERAVRDQPLARIHGPLRGILTAERVALNFLGRLCGVASFTRRFADAVSGTGARIVDTRKTLPGWRELDKYAVATGGGVNHRVGLYDGILLKDNHIAAAGGVALAVKSALAGAPDHLRVQVEVESERDAEAAVAAGADFLLLDNCSPTVMRAIVDRLAGHVTLEASGGVSLDNVREIAETGVHRISIGALTHSAPCADVALEVDDPDPGVAGA